MLLLNNHGRFKVLGSPAVENSVSCCSVDCLPNLFGHRTHLPFSSYKHSPGINFRDSWDSPSILATEPQELELTDATSNSCGYQSPNALGEISSSISPATDTHTLGLVTTQLNKMPTKAQKLTRAIRLCQSQEKVTCTEKHCTAVIPSHKPSNGIGAVSQEVVFCCDRDFQGRGTENYSCKQVYFPNLRLHSGLQSFHRNST